MKRYLLITFLFLCITSLFAKDELDIVMAELNNVIDNKKAYDLEKEEKINKLRSLLVVKDLSESQLYDINLKLVKEYQKYQLDSAIHYAQKNTELTSKIENKTLKYNSLLQLSILFSGAGRFIEAEKILRTLPRSEMRDENLELYYTSYSQLYGYYAQSNNASQYYAINELYKDSLLSILPPNSVSRKINETSKLLYAGQIDIVNKRLEELLTLVDESSPDYPIVTYLVAYMYEKKKDRVLQKKYYALSAIADIKDAIKDNASIQKIAILMYEDKNITMAYKLTKSAIDDAVFCNVRFRTIELSEFYSVINNVYQIKEEKQKSELKSYLIAISVLALFLIIGVVYIYKQMNRLARIRKELYRTNVTLNKLNQEIINSNQKLFDSNLVKEEYIARFFDMCSTYINKLENYRKSLSKKAANNELNELFKMLKSTTFVETELNELYKNFDDIFLSLYPSFVEEFNNLLIKEEQIMMKPGEKLNTELRIFALIRLGIIDSVKIASFLRYSLSTIYNYRTKARNKAAVSRDDFEAMVMKIGLNTAHK